MLFNTLNLIFLNVTMPNWTTKICAQISLAGLYLDLSLMSDLSIHISISIWYLVSGIASVLQFYSQDWDSHT